MKKSLYICSFLAVLLLTACEQNVPVHRTQRGWEIENRWYLCARSMTSEFIAEMFDMNALLYGDSLTRVQMASQFADYAVFESVGDTLFVLQRYHGAMPHIVVIDNHRLTDVDATWTLILNADNNLIIGQKMYYDSGRVTSCASDIGQVAANTPVTMTCTAERTWTIANNATSDVTDAFAAEWQLQQQNDTLVSNLYTTRYVLSGKGVFLLEQNVALVYEMDRLTVRSLYNPDRFETGKVQITAHQLGTGETLDVAVAYAGTSKEITYRGITETY
ncbi:MAG: hypothetical protein ACI392_01930 [Paludibacteraceae bacterium]